MPKLVSHTTHYHHQLVEAARLRLWSSRCADLMGTERSGGARSPNKEAELPANADLRAGLVEPGTCDGPVDTMVDGLQFPRCSVLDFQRRPKELKVELARLRSESPLQDDFDLLDSVPCWFQCHFVGFRDRPSWQFSKRRPLLVSVDIPFLVFRRPCTDLT